MNQHDRSCSVTENMIIASGCGTFFCDSRLSLTLHTQLLWSDG